MPSNTAGPVVQRVRQDVHLGVLPPDELPVHPDEVRLLHALVLSTRPRRARQARRSPPGVIAAVPTCDLLRLPRGEIRSAETAAPAPGRWPILPPPPRSSIRSEWRSISATDPKVASGFATPCPAMSGAEPCTGSYRPGPPRAEACRLPSRPDRARDHRGLVGEDVAEHVLGQDHVEVAGARDQLHRGVVDQHVLELHAG